MNVKNLLKYLINIKMNGCLIDLIFNYSLDQLFLYQIAQHQKKILLIFFIKVILNILEKDRDQQKKKILFEDKNWLRF